MIFNREESERHNVEFNKPVIEEYTYYDSIYIKEEANSISLRDTDIKIITKSKRINPKFG